MESALGEAALRPSRFSAARTARLRRADGRRGFLLPCPTSYARLAELRVLAFACPLVGGLSGTPARRALERPMAIACFVERAPCFPSRMCSISSRTNSPAAVVGFLPWRRSFFALSTVSFSGMVPTFLSTAYHEHALAPGRPFRRTGGGTGR